MRTKRIFAVLTLAVLIAGCTAAQWFALVKSLLPLAADIAIQFSTFANKGSIPAGDVALIQKYSANVQTLFGDISADVTAWQADKSPSRLTHISTLLSEIKSQSADLLTQIQFKDANTQAFVMAILQDSIDLAGLIPVVATKGTASGSEVKERVSLPRAKALEAIFKFRLANLPK